MKVFIYIGMGGMAGSLLRYVISEQSTHALGSSFPFGTLIVNLAGAFILGLFTSLVIRKKRLTNEWRLAIGTGAIGSFTTLSTLSNETVMLIDEQAYIKALLYISISLVGGLAAAFAGYHAGLGKKEAASHD
ncbi:fluoride efflux transporter CrcB [Bacillus sp. ISL-47]|uniref:fluoride efflux transporter CrcB n=1 Tax=Bacillus sp. ISL-47 TaxID=2819130 RepID=UPI001BE70C04|nr:fluoride efflux transporter CrcB [Bacillus sp. ISL-47]MBT2691211.1 fluoride efflux transporter CrcB [Bacillus sp. ISL-47]